MDVCQSFRTSITDEKITQMENLMKVVLTVSVDNERELHGFTTALYLLLTIVLFLHKIQFDRLHSTIIEAKRDRCKRCRWIWNDPTSSLMCTKPYCQHVNLIHLIRLLIENGARM